MLNIRWSHDHLIFNMGIPIPGKDGLYIETGPRLNAKIPSAAKISIWHQLLNTLEVSAPIPLKCRLVSPPLKNVLSSFDAKYTAPKLEMSVPQPLQLEVSATSEMQMSAPPLKKRTQFVRKNRFENEIEGQGQSNPKLIGIFNKAKIHFWSQFGNHNLNRWWVVTWTSSKWGQFWLSS